MLSSIMTTILLYRNVKSMKREKMGLFCRMLSHSSRVFVYYESSVVCFVTLFNLNDVN